MGLRLNLLQRRNLLIRATRLLEPPRRRKKKRSLHLQVDPLERLLKKRRRENCLQPERRLNRLSKKTMSYVLSH